MKRILLLFALLFGMTFAYMAWKPSDKHEQVQGNWDIYDELDREAAENRAGWR